MKITDLDLDKFAADASRKKQLMDSSQKTIDQEKVKKNQGDSINISDAAKALFSSYQIGAPSQNDEPGAVMKAITAKGTQVTLEAVSSETKTYTMGKKLTAFHNDKNKKAYQLITWSNGNNTSANMEFVATFKKVNGETKSFLLEGNTAFTEDEEGNIFRKGVSTNGQLVGTDENDILFNIGDDTLIDGGKGDDIILNMGKNATITGGDGNDVITSMGDGAVITGGDGDDAIAVIHDTLRHALEKNTERNFEQEDDGTQRRPLSQTISINGGNGDDEILVRPELFQGDIKGGNGDDKLDLGNVTSSKVDAGEGNNTMLMKDVLKSQVISGAGDDYVSIEVLDRSTVSLGGGNDTLNVEYAFESSIYGVENVTIGKNWKTSIQNKAIQDSPLFDFMQNPESEKEILENNTEESHNTMEDRYSTSEISERESDSTLKKEEKIPEKVLN